MARPTKGCAGNVDERAGTLDTFLMSAETTPPILMRPQRRGLALNRAGGQGRDLLRTFHRAFFLAVVCALALLLAPGLSRAEEAQDAALDVPPARAHKLPTDKHAQLDGLYAVLKVAPDDSSSRQIADRIDQIFADAGSPSADYLMTRAAVAAEAKQYELALEILDQVIAFEPDYIAALSRRATIRYLRDDYGGALADIREVLAREPRQFSMLYGLALILKDIGDEKRALDAVRRALAINPHIDGADEMEKQLAIKVEGRLI